MTTDAWTATALTRCPCCSTAHECWATYDPELAPGGGFWCGLTYKGWEEDYAVELWPACCPASQAADPVLLRALYQPAIAELAARVGVGPDLPLAGEAGLAARWTGAACVQVGCREGER